MRPSRLMLATVLVAGFALIRVGSAAAATTSSELLKCQKTIEKGVRSLAGQTLGQVTNCSTKVVNCQLAGEIDAEDTGDCLNSASASCAKAPTKVSTALTKTQNKAITACGLIPFAELQAYLAGLGFFNVVAECGAADVNALMTCIFADGRCRAETQAFLLDPRAQNALTTAGVAASFPCVAP